MSKMYDWDLHKWLKSEEEIQKAKEDKHLIDEYPNNFNPKTGKVENEK